MTKTSRPDSLTGAELRALSGQGTVKTFQKHTVIVSEGDETDSLYVVLSGRVKVFVADESAFYESSLDEVRILLPFCVLSAALRVEQKSLSFS